MDTDEIMRLVDEAGEPHRDGLEEGQVFPRNDRHRA
jgi:hypothetical protein